MFFPYRSVMPVSLPRLLWSFTVQLSHSYSPPKTSSTDPSVPPRHERIEAGAFVWYVVEVVTSVQKVKGQGSTAFCFSFARASAAVVAASGSAFVGMAES